MATRVRRQNAMDEGRQPAANPEDDTAPGGLPPGPAVDRATAAAIGSPSKTRTLNVPDVEPDYTPEYVDRHFMEAYTRYIGLLANGVSHHWALRAVQRADPNFDLDEAAAISILEKLHKTNEPVKLAEDFFLFATTAPPPHVTNVYDALEYTDDMTAALADDLYDLYQDAWIAAMNENLSRLGKPIITKVTEEGTLKDLKAMAEEQAKGIADTYNRDLATALYGTYIEHHAVLGRQSSETILREAMQQWANNRAEWKSEQIATTETNRAFNEAMRVFRDRNRDVTSGYGRIVPYGGQCDACQDASMLGRQPAEIIIELGIPLHVGCVHSIEWEVSSDWGGGDVWTGGE